MSRNPIRSDTKSFSAGQVTRLTGIPYRTLDFWARTDFFNASVPANGPGSDRLYTLPDVIALAAIYRLRGHGFETSAIAEHMKFIRGMTARRAQKIVVIQSGDRAITTRLDLAQVEEEVRGAIEGSLGSGTHRSKKDTAGSGT